MASSMSFRKIWPMPARRSGNSSHQSTSHRLWARMPARRCWYSSGGGGLAKSTKLGKNGGTVLGKTTSPTMPSASCCELRISLSQLRKPAGVAEVLVRVLVLAPPGVEVLEVGGVEVLAVGGVAAAGVAVGRDDRVALVGVDRSRHGGVPLARARSAPWQSAVERVLAPAAARSYSGDVGLLAVEQVVVQFGGVRALDEVDLDVPPAAITGLIGPNGAGKTTLFNVICGLQPTVAGHVRLGDELLDGRSPHHRARLGIARTFQRLEVFGSMSVRDNVRVAAEVRRTLVAGQPPGGADGPARPGGRAARAGRARRGRRGPRRLAAQRARPGWWRWRGRWPASPGCSCSTSPPRGSTRRRPMPSAICSRGWPRRAWPSCSSSTTSTW